MSICEICTGRHSTSACVTALVYVEQCLLGTPDDARPEFSNKAVELVTELTYLRQPTGRAIYRTGRYARNTQGIPVLRIA